MIEHIELTEAYEATPAALAGVAADAIRALNHATFPGRARLTYPVDAYDVLGPLRELAAVLPQALAQLGTWLQREHANDRIVLAEGMNASLEDFVGALDDGLHRAMAYLDATAGELRVAHSLAAQLGGVSELVPRREHPALSLLCRVQQGRDHAPCSGTTDEEVERPCECSCHAAAAGVEFGGGAKWR